jgi:hypothetical protein
MAPSRRIRLTDSPFADRTGAGIVVAVIDSGVHAGHPHVGPVAESVAIPTEGIDPVFDTVDRLGHGTAVASAIRDLAPGVTLIVGKIFDKSRMTNADALARGIDWAAGRAARLINLSLGTSNHRHRERLVASIEASRAIVVAARDWLPGSLPGVVGVVADPTLERDEFRVEGTWIIASPYPRSIPGVPRERNLSGVSFAVANVTGALARLLEIHPDVRSLDNLLTTFSAEVS